MALKNTIDSYGSVTKSFHWTIALLVLFMLILGVVMHDFPKSIKPTVYTLHKSVGLTMFVLMVLRLLWRCCNVRPPLPNSVPRWQKMAANWNHGLLYAAIIIMPIIGLLMSSAGGYPTHVWWSFKILLPIPKSKPLANFFGYAHATVAVIILCLIVLHVCGAFKHYLIDKDHVLQRMLPWKTKK